MKKIFLLAAVVFFLGININAQVAVIANKSVPESSINLNKVTDIYSSKVKNWSDGSKIVRFTVKTDDASNKFFAAIGKSHADLKKVWMKLQLTGEGQAPEALGADDEVISRVASTPGAIGYISASNANDKVKVILTIN